MRRGQLDFFLLDKKSLNSAFGGSRLTSNPKTARPISSKHLMHIILKSEEAHGKLSFLRKERELLKVARGLGAKLNVRINDIVVMSNHIHLLLLVKSRRGFASFLRAYSGIIARKILGAEKARPAALRKLFKGRPFSRIVAAGRKSWRLISRYFELNRLEKLGFSKALSRELSLAAKLPP